MPPLVNDPVFKFCCKTCGQKISVPEGLQGQKFSCPNCAAQGHVPDAEPWEFTADPGSIIKFHCASCDQKLSARDGQQGKKFTCPNCADRGQVPGAEPRKPAAERGSVIKFYCPSCQQKLSVPEGLRGQKYSCPNCAARSHVPGGEPRELMAEREDTLKFLCRNCQQKLSCAADSVGQAIECPICHKETIAQIGTPDPPSTLPPAFSENPIQMVVLPEKKGAVRNGAGKNGSANNGAGNNGAGNNGAGNNGVRKEIPQVADHRLQREPKPTGTPNGEINGSKEAKREPSKWSGGKQAGKPSWWQRILGGGEGSLWEEDAEPSVVPIERPVGNEAVRNGNGTPKPEAVRNGNGTPKPEAVRNGNGAPKPEAARNSKRALRTEALEALPEIELPTKLNGHGPDPDPEVKTVAPEKIWEPSTTIDELFESLIKLGFEVEHISAAQEDGAAGDR